MQLNRKVTTNINNSLFILEVLPLPLMYIVIILSDGGRDSAGWMFWTYAGLAVVGYLIGRQFVKYESPIKAFLSTLSPIIFLVVVMLVYSVNEYSN